MNMNMNMTCTCQARSRERRDGEGGGSIRGIGGEARDARRPTGIGACSSQPREEIRKCQCVCARALVQWRISLKKGSNAKPKGGGEKTGFRFSFRSHNTGATGRHGARNRHGRPHPLSDVAHAVKMILDLGRRSVVLAASHVIALGRLTLPFCLARAESLARARALSSLSRLSPTLANFMPPRGRPPLADLEHLSTG